MRVCLELKETSQQLVIHDALNTYTKGPFFCIYLRNGTVTKIPLANIWRISEDYQGDES